MDPESIILHRRRRLTLAGAAAALVAAGLPVVAPAAATCDRTLTANVVAIDQPLMFNRLGAQNVNGMIYALRRDIVDVNSGLPEAAGGTLQPGQVRLRPDKRPRPLALRLAKGECLQVHFTNLLDPNPNPNDAPIAGAPAFNLEVDDQVASRTAGFHVQGLELVNSIADDSSFVGENASSLVEPGQSATYTFYGAEENGYLVSSYGATFGGQGSAANVGDGLFGIVNVEPRDASFYRSQVTEEELRLVTTGTTASGHPVIDYEAVYPDVEPWVSEGKAGLPVLNMVHGGEIVHGDVNAIIAYKDPATGGLGAFPADTYPLESQGLRNPSVPNRLEAFREFSTVFHGEVAAVQAFPGWYNDPVLSHTLASVVDAFMINYGSGGIGSEIIGDRLGVGPMHDCMDCAYEEFFLSSWGVSDPGMNVDIPANFGLENCDPNLNNCEAVGPKANFALYPDDPANVHHSYTNDFVKFRNVHAGSEHHIFHLHNHQWLFNPNDDDSNYIDAQAIGPGSSYTYEIAFGGSGNRNKTAGDAIFHCHFYPHFAQGMWELWRVHDVFEGGTRLAVSQTASGFHDDPFELFNGTPANNQGIVDAGSPHQNPTPSFETTTRALPDGEIVVGTPIPALVPLPGKPMAPVPGDVVVRAKDADGDGIPDSGQAKVDRADTDPALVDAELNPTGLKNPGFPFWIAGIEHTVGQRATTPPLDMDPDAGGFDGGLPRHTLEGFKGGSANVEFATRLDFSVEVEKAKPFFFPQQGTDVERAAMAFHQKRCHDTFLADGTAAACDTAVLNDSGKPDAGGFITNGAPPVPGAPYNEPCIDDQGDPLMTGGAGEFFAAQGLDTLGPVEFGADAPREYKAAVIQTDVTFNKVGYHNPQQRIITLWEDVAPTLNKTRPPEPFTIRLNTFDCADYLHVNLVPKEYQLDDYQVDTPTDVIGQHIHLPKWDLTSSDGAANGWNYEDGTKPPDYVRELIEAINLFNAEQGVTEITDVEGNPVMNSAGEVIGPQLEPLVHPFFGPGPQDFWIGARTTIQRWFADPVRNVGGEDRGLGVIFTHDHYSPSTHQQVGLYGTVITEPAGSTWVHNETGELLFNEQERIDGGPTSWQAAILTGDTDGDGSDDSFREFFLEYQDFQHAYEKGVFVGVGPDGITPVPPTPDSFRSAINPSFRQNVNPVFPDLIQHPPFCPGGVPRPCPEAVDADDVGMFVVNYRNEPIGLRVFDPNKVGPDGRPGTQADGLGGDLAFALQTRTNRAIPEMNTVLGDSPYPRLTGDLRPGDAFTPMMRSYSGDTVRIRTQSGAHEELHNTTVHGLKWLQGGSANGDGLNSGWRNSQSNSIAENFTFTTPVVADFTQIQPVADYAYSMDASHDGWWSGMWGVMRNYKQRQDDLFALPDTHPAVTAMSTPTLRSLAEAARTASTEEERLQALADLRDGVLEAIQTAAQNFDQFRFGGMCPADAPLRRFDITAVLANDVLGNAVGVDLVPDGPSATQHEGGPLDPAGGTLVYNPRPTQLAQVQVADEETGEITTLGGQSGPLHDPTAMMYVHTADLEPAPTNDTERFICNWLGGVKALGCPVKLTADAPVEPIILRAEAGDCIDVRLRNRLPQVAPDLAGYTLVLPVVHRDRGDPGSAEGVTWFNNNLVRPSSHVGLHPQLVEYDVSRSDGANVGINRGGLLDPFQTLAPGNPVPERYVWYAGDIVYQPTGPGTFSIQATPIEFGTTTLLPADTIKQGQKGLSGALIIEPEGATWVENDRQRDRQVNDPAATRATRAQATVTAADGADFRDAVTVLQKGINMRFADASPVPATPSENQGVPEDPEDSGQQAINYGTEPLWFRFGLPPDLPFGNADQGFGAVADSERAFSNGLIGGEDPVTPVFTADAGQQTRVRLLQPTGVARGITYNLHGHVWQRDPYVCPGDAHVGLPGKCEPGSVGSQAIGENPVGVYYGGQESVNSTAHYDVVVPAGGAFGVTGDYLYRDQGGLGVTQGLWGLLRVAP